MELKLGDKIDCDGDMGIVVFINDDENDKYPVKVRIMEYLYLNVEFWFTRDGSSCIWHDTYEGN